MKKFYLNCHLSYIDVAKVHIHKLIFSSLKNPEQGLKNQNQGLKNQNKSLKNLNQAMIFELTEENLRSQSHRELKVIENLTSISK